jgi:hypothetical protein
MSACALGGQPYYASEAFLFNLTGAESFDPERCRGNTCPGQYPPPSNEYRDFLFTDATGALNPSQTHMKCVPGHLSPACTCAQWNFFNRSARERYYGIVSQLASSDPGNKQFDGIFFGAHRCRLHCRTGSAGHMLTLSMWYGCD